MENFFSINYRLNAIEILGIKVHRTQGQENGFVHHTYALEELGGGYLEAHDGEEDVHILESLDG